MIEEEKLEGELIAKLWKRLDKIREAKGVKFPYSTYDTNVILQEVGSEIRQARIVEERQQRKFPSDAQMKLINDLRSQTGELPADAKEFTTNDQVDSEITRLKNKRKGMGK